jgi:hypothetical protein
MSDSPFIALLANVVILEIAVHRKNAPHCDMRALSPRICESICGQRNIEDRLLHPGDTAIPACLSAHRLTG